MKSQSETIPESFDQKGSMLIMASLINGHLYRIGLDSEYNYSYVAADSLEDLIRFLVEEYTGNRIIVGVKEIRKDGTLHPVSVTGTSLFQFLTAQKLKAEPFLLTEIDGQLWIVLLPTGGEKCGDRFNQWDRATRSTALRDDLFHYHSILSLCKDCVGENKSKCVVRGGTAVHGWDTIPISLRHIQHGYRPMLLPVNADTLQLDPKRLDKIRDGAHLKAGCLYMDDVPLPNPKKPVLDGDIPHYRPGARLSFGDTPEDDAFCIQWIKCGTGLISDRNLLLDLSWDDLDRQGLAYGKVTKDWSKSRKPSIKDQVNIAKQHLQEQGRGVSNLGDYKESAR